MRFNDIKPRLERWAQAVQKVGGFAHLEIGPTAKLQEVEYWNDARFKNKLPQALKDLYCGFAKKVDFRWSIQDDVPGVPAGLQTPVCGGCDWNLSKLDLIEPGDYW